MKRCITILIFSLFFIAFLSAEELTISVSFIQGKAFLKQSKTNQVLKIDSILQNDSIIIVEDNCVLELNVYKKRIILSRKGEYALQKLVEKSNQQIQNQDAYTIVKNKLDKVSTENIKNQNTVGGVRGANVLETDFVFDENPFAPARDLLLANRVEEALSFLFDAGYSEASLFDFSLSLQSAALKSTDFTDEEALKLEATILYAEAMYKREQSARALTVLLPLTGILKDSSSFLLLAQIYFSLHDFTEAKTYASKIISMQAPLEEIQLAYFIEYYSTIQEGNKIEALSFLSKGIKILPDSLEAIKMREYDEK